MLREAIAKLEAALEIIDRHDVPLAGIHVANALTILTERVEAAEASQKAASKGRNGGKIN